MMGSFACRPEHSVMILKRSPLADIENIAELLARLGDISPERVRFFPFPGTATERDLLKQEKGFELVDGTLVEKPVGYYESRLAVVLAHFIELFLERHDLGLTNGEEAPFRVRRRTVRKPDVSFVSWDKIPNRQLPPGGIAAFVPDLAVEILSRSNTKAEMLRKREEYFRAGTKLVWEIQPMRQTAKVYTSPRRFTRVEPNGVLDGGDVLPGFRLPLRDLFAGARVSPSPRRRRS
jgi:Uma2 family endonuclease